MRKVSRKDANLKVSDGIPRIVLLALPSPNDASSFITNLVAYNLTDAVLMHDMIRSVESQIVAAIIDQTMRNERKRIANVIASVEIEQRESG